MTITQRTDSYNLGRSRRLTVAVASLGTAALVVGGSTAATGAAPLAAETPATGAVSGEYVVVLKDPAGLKAAGVAARPQQKQVETAVARGQALGAEVQEQFTAAVAGYSATLSSTELAAVRADPAVAYVQPNLTYRVSGTTQKSPTWGLDRIDQRSLPLSKSYYYTATGKGVTAYVLDTGIARHPDLNQIGTGMSVIEDGRGVTDCHGHGTHVSGTVGGTKYGVAKDVTLVPIRVLDCQGWGTTEGIVAGIEHVIQAPVTGPRVVNMSLGDPQIDKVVDAAVKRMVDAGITVVLAAGNDNVSACTSSPARVKSAITVGATDKKDRRASFSNYGGCVDIYAPGVDIHSSYLRIGGVWENGKMSGTSMAAPHVTGTVAMYLQRNPKATPAQVQAALIKAATKNKVTPRSTQYPRLLLMGLQKAVAPASVTSGNKLKYNQSLVGSKKLCSNNGTYCLSHSGGKLQLRKVTGANKRVVWSAGKSVAWTRMTSTGALSSYDAYQRRVWTSKKTGGKATMTVISSGYLKITRDSDKKVLWTSKG